MIEKKADAINLFTLSRGRDKSCEKLVDDLRELPCTRPEPQMPIMEDVEL